MKRQTKQQRIIQLEALLQEQCTLYQRLTQALREAVGATDLEDRLAELERQQEHLDQRIDNAECAIDDLENSK